MSSIAQPSPANRQTTQATSTTRQLPRQQQQNTQATTATRRPTFADYVTQFYGVGATCIVREPSGRYNFNLVNLGSIGIMERELREWVNGGMIGTGSGGGGTGTTTRRKPMSLAARQKLSEAARRRAAERQALTVGNEGHTEPVRATKRAKTMAAGN